MRSLRLSLALGLVLLLTALPANATDYQVSIPGKYFDPDRLVVLVGDTVTWTNRDVLTHTATALDDSFDSGDLVPGKTFSFTFTRPGMYEYICTIHRFAAGLVEVYAMSLTGPSRVVPVGGRGVLRGLAPAGTGTVTIEQRAPDGTFAPLTSVTPAADGSFRAAVTPSSPAVYRATAGELASPPVSVAVSARITLEARRVGAAFVIRVAASPPQPRAPVVLQIYARERFDWVPLARGHLDRSSQASFTLQPRRGLHVRAVLLRGFGGFSPGQSNVIVIGGNLRLARARLVGSNPRLSAAPLTTGVRLRTSS